MDETREAGRWFLTVDLCKRHGFPMLALSTIDDNGYGSGTRLLGSKSCCADRREIVRWRVTPDDLGRLAGEWAALAAVSREAPR